MSSTSQDFPPEYANYNSGPYVIRVVTAVTVLATVFVALRFAVRFNRRLGFALDDWLCLISLIFLWAEYADGYLCIKRGGVGYHLPIAIAIKSDALRNVFVVSNNLISLRGKQLTR